jgi:hypothetical protein
VIDLQPAKQFASKRRIVLRRNIAVRPEYSRLARESQIAVQKTECKRSWSVHRICVGRFVGPARQWAPWNSRSRSTNIGSRKLIVPGPDAILELGELSSKCRASRPQAIAQMLK